MYLSSISIVNYKSIVEANLDFCNGINCFIGNNGVGKTNLLDAIYYLSFCKSHTNPIDTQNVKHNEQFFVLQGNYHTQQQNEDIYIGLKRGQKKMVKRNKQAYERLSHHIGLLPLVLVSPHDTILIDGGSEERRKFLDGVISQFDKKYLENLLKYQHLLQQRNALLKAGTHQQEETLYEVCEWQMASLASYIYNKRLDFIQSFIPVFQHYYAAIAQVNEVVDIQYKSHCEHGDLQEQLKNNRSKDLLLGYTSKGIHKDELEFYLGDYLVKRIGSQGQNKTFLIALKLAQFDFLKQVHQCRPLLLLDDIFDKLDTLRVSKIIELVSGDNFGQIFITDTNRDHIVGILSAMPQTNKIFMVTEQGIISE